jgi:hypothetical protein
MMAVAGMVIGMLVIVDPSRVLDFLFDRRHPPLRHRRRRRVEVVMAWVLLDGPIVRGEPCGRR